MSTGSLPKCCRFITLSASVILPSVVIGIDVVDFDVPLDIHCIQKKKHPILFSCITLRKSNQFETNLNENLRQNSE